ncbi:hypothetical protein [uncultured Dysosmobacter sp.]|uniref:hypothetical protein n=1 Tax=uncultured Dysosmobacter sp. TaxID=2591384 RepID=UPI00263176C8|nr:hypothetical protein [uncultured Dysosmobacter sp.]
MPHIADTQGILRENLSDAGCGPELIERFMALAEQGQEEEGLALLAKHRKHLLDRCHAEQKKIDCLDYLVYQMKKETRKTPQF